MIPNQVFGMTFDVILELRAQYLRYNGPAVITAESVRKTFKDLMPTPLETRFEYRMAESKRVRERNLMRCPYQRSAR